MASINPDIISNVQSKVDQNSSKFQAEQALEALLSDMKAQVKSSTFLEAFPQGGEDYNACISYLGQSEPGDPQLEEINDDIRGRVNAAQEAWEELFYGPTAVSRSQGGQRMFFVDYAMSKNIPGVEGLAAMQDDAENPSQAVGVVADGFKEWARKEMPQGSHAQGSRVYRNTHALNELGSDMEENTMPLAEMTEMINDNMAIVLSALDTLDQYRLQLAKTFDPDQEETVEPDVDDQNTSEV